MLVSRLVGSEDVWSSRGGWAHVGLCCASDFCCPFRHLFVPCVEGWEDAISEEL